MLNMFYQILLTSISYLHPLLFWTLFFFQYSIYNSILLLLSYKFNCTLTIDCPTLIVYLLVYDRCQIHSDVLLNLMNLYYIFSISLKNKCSYPQFKLRTTRISYETKLLLAVPLIIWISIDRSNERSREGEGER